MRAGPRTNGIRPNPFHADEMSARNARNYGSGGRSGLCAHLRTLGSRRGSSLQLVQRTAGAFPKLRWLQLPSASLVTAFVGLPHAGHALLVRGNITLGCGVPPPVLDFSPAVAAADARCLPELEPTPFFGR